MQLQNIFALKNLAYLFIFLIFTPCFSQTEKGIISKAHDDIVNNKYETAFNLLDSFDPHNANADIVLIKENIALTYYVETVNFQMFSFKDMGKNESIKDYRRKLGSSKMHVFKINKILDSLRKIYPQNYKLDKGLGDFYYAVHEKYNDKWLISEKEIIGMIENFYKIAIDNNLGDFQTDYRLGLIYVTDENYQAGIPYLEKAVQLDNSNADAHYNLAYASLNVNDTDNALRHSLIAAKLYRDSSAKGDAARMAGVVFGEMGNQKKAIEFMELSNKIAPNNYNTLKILFDIYLMVYNHKKERQVTNEFYELGPEKPTIYNDLVDIYTANNQPKQLIAFFQSKLKPANGDLVQLGSLYLYIGRLYVGIDKNLATENLTKAAQVFSAIYKPDNPIFKLIYDTMKGLK